MAILNFKGMKFSFAAATHSISHATFLFGILHKGNAGRFKFAATIELLYPNA